MQNFAGKIALITGAASGIGAATAKHLASCGIGKLILCDRDGDGLEQIALDTQIVRLNGDVGDPVFWQAAAPHLNGLHFAVANAGISRGAAITDIAYDDWRAIMAVNLDGVFLTVQHAMRAMIAGASGGAIVLSASASGIKARAGTAAYSASKAAVIHFGKIAAVEAAAHNIRVNIIAPGGVKTAIWNDVPGFDDMLKKYGSREKVFDAFADMGAAMGIPSPRFAEASEIAAQIAFLLDDAACGTMTGNVLVSDGGYSL